MECIEREAMCMVTVNGDLFEGDQLGPTSLYENITVSQAVEVVQQMKLNDILKWLNINPDKIEPWGELWLGIQIHTGIDDSINDDQWPLILQKHWKFHNITT
jgi:hypothetical protein